MEGIDEQPGLRILCPKKSLERSPAGIQWLIGAPAFLPRFTVVSSLRCLHFLAGADPFSPDIATEADELKVLLPKGLSIVGSLYAGSGSLENNVRKALDNACEMSKLLNVGELNYPIIGAAADLNSGDIHFFANKDAKSKNVEEIVNIVYEDHLKSDLWGLGCLLKCELSFRLPVYVPLNKKSDRQKVYSTAIEAAAAKFRDSDVIYLVETSNVAEGEASRSIALHGAELNFNTTVSNHIPSKNDANGSNSKTILCSYFCSRYKSGSSASGKNSDVIHVSVFTNQSRNTSKWSAPVAEYFPASEPINLVVIEVNLNILAYASKDYPLADAISQMVIPGLVDQLSCMKRAIVPSCLTDHPQLHPYHFQPPGFLHPVTAIYDLRYGEKEMKQVELRKSLHLRLGLPLDRPLLLIANALPFDSGKNGNKGSSFIRSVLRDVHQEVPSSGVSGGITSLVDGSYEYFHYLHDGFDDNGWGCAYRSLQTIISWFKLQNYTSIEVPSHREIQQALVEIGDKEPSFIGSREWIGAIELSFVLDKLLGVSCKIINVRSGDELPEKCRELAAHFETQGTPVMIGGGVLAYTLLGVDYNETSGDCAFLILDPHYTGNDDLKKIVNGGWCGWKKSVDSKGRSFFLRDKFYNLLLPQRPNMV